MIQELCKAAAELHDLGRKCGLLGVELAHYKHTTEVQISADKWPVNTPCILTDEGSHIGRRAVMDVDGRQVVLTAMTPKVDLRSYARVRGLYFDQSETEPDGIRQNNATTTEGE